MVHWSGYFWGESNRGLDVLSSNVKNGAIAIEEFQRFLNESIQCESAYCKNLSRLQSQLQKTQYLGTFTPIWYIIRDLFDKISAIHATAGLFHQELLREIHNYQELYQKKVKVHIQKDVDITRTVDLISNLNNALHVVNKAKEQYHSVASDYERTKRNLSSTSNNASSNASQENSSLSLTQTAMNTLATKQLDRLEKKNRIAQDEYKATIEKYNSIRNDYEKRFHDACTKFQDFEIDHVEKMLAFSLNYSEILQRSHQQMSMAQEEFCERLKALSGNDLLDTFVDQKKTGTERPAPLQFEELDSQKAPATPSTISSLSDHPPLGQDDPTLFDQTESGVPSFEAHFTVPIPNSKSADNNRVLSTHTSNNHAQTMQSQHPVSPTFNVSTSSTGSTTLNNPTTRTQESSNSGDLVPNPFDLKIRRPKFTGFFGSNRKERKLKKDEKKSSSNTTSSKTFQLQQSTEESHGNNLQNVNYDNDGSNKRTDNLDASFSKSHNADKNKPITPESGIMLNPLMFNKESSNRSSYGTGLSQSSDVSSSNDSSDDEDDNDNVVTKVAFKINPKTDVVSEADNEMKIINAMQNVEKNMGNFFPSRLSPIKTSEVSKSSSNEQLGHRLLPPPPLPARTTTNTPNSGTNNNVDYSLMFPPHDGFDRPPVNNNFSNSINQENFQATLGPPHENNNGSPISFIDDDTEVTDSHPNNESTSKTTSSSNAAVSSTNQTDEHEKIWSSISSPMTGLQSNIYNDLTTSNEHKLLSSQADNIDQIPLAIAFQEVFHATMCGTNQENWKSQIVGEMLISFPTSMLNLLADPLHVSNILKFHLKNLDHISNITTDSSLIIKNEQSEDPDEPIYAFDMAQLNNTLRQLHETKPSSRFFNLTLLHYEVKNSEASNIPIQISSKWSRTLDTISVDINYIFNSSALPDSVRLNNDSVIFYTIITDGRGIRESSPVAEWTSSECKLWWKVPYVANGAGNLSATILTSPTNTNEQQSDEQQEQPLITSSTVHAYFLGENALFSSIDFDLACKGYRISLLKKKMLSGKYESEPDQSEPLHLFQRPITSPT